LRSFPRVSVDSSGIPPPFEHTNSNSEPQSLADEHPRFAGKAGERAGEFSYGSVSS
jgi:hypothetical protein